MNDPLFDTAEDWIDEETPLTEVFPDGFSKPCERCARASLGGRWCPDCEIELMELPF